MTIEELARSTKINASILEALEHDEIDKLPAPFYTRAFIRTYATEVGLDPEIILSHYLSEYEPEPTIAPAEQAVVDASERRSVVNPAPRMQFQPPTLSPRLLIAAAVVLAIAVYFVYPRQHSSPEQVSAQEPAVAQAALAATPTPQVAKAVVPPAGEVLKFDIKPGGPCWVQITSDGRTVLSRLLQPGERETIEMRSEMVIRVGDPGAFGFSIDGVTGRPLGNAGQPVTVKITRDNYREFLAL